MLKIDENFTDVLMKFLLKITFFEQKIAIFSTIFPYSPYCFTYQLSRRHFLFYRNEYEVVRVRSTNYGARTLKKQCQNCQMQNFGLKLFCQTCQTKSIKGKVVQNFTLIRMVFLIFRNSAKKFEIFPKIRIFRYFGKISNFLQKFRKIFYTIRISIKF